jgi:hypothetical protein
MAGEVVQIISISVAEATMVIPYRNRGVQGFHRPELGAIGMILGVTKDVDMKFMLQYERARFQVLVLDPSLIPHSIDVVIGEYIYELHFKVEQEEMVNPMPIDMDDNVVDDREDDGAERSN